MSDNRTLSRENFASEFSKYRPLLRSFLLRITASVSDVDDIVQDAFLKAYENLDSFKGKSSFKTWVFAIASNIAKDNFRAKTRWVEHVTDLAREAALADRAFMQESMRIRTASPFGQFEIREHIAFCFNCISKSLPIEQQICLLLKDVFEFTVKEIEQIIDSTEAMVKYYLHAARQKMIRIFDGRCALINKEGICHQCSELNGIFNPEQKFQEEAMKIEMAKEAGKAGKEKLFDLRLKIVQNVDPFHSKASELQLHHLEHNRRTMEEFLEKKED